MLGFQCFTGAFFTVTVWHAGNVIEKVQMLVIICAEMNLIFSASFKAEIFWILIVGSALIILPILPDVAENEPWRNIQ